MNTENELNRLQQEAYQQRLEVNRLRREVFQQPDPAGSEALMAELQTAESVLSRVEAEIASLESQDTTSGLVASVGRKSPAAGTLGAKSTGLQAQVYLRLQQVPTSIYHLMNVQESPLVSCTVTSTGGNTVVRRVRVTSYIDGYSAKAVSTAELAPGAEQPFNQMPTLFPSEIANLNELARATLCVLVEDLDNNRVEINTTYPIWLLARTTAPLAVKDPKTGGWIDLTPYLGAFVTPNSPPVMEFLRAAARCHPQGRLVGYQVGKEEVEPQVRALFEALKSNADITYVNSVIQFSPDEGLASQRVRLPRESLSHRQANCIDGTVLFASLLEGISMIPAIVIVPGHAFVAWRTWVDGPEQWAFLETTMIGSHSFDEARASAEKTAAFYKQQAVALNSPTQFRLHSLRSLRAERKIMPME